MALGGDLPDDHVGGRTRSSTTRSTSSSWRARSATSRSASRPTRDGHPRSTDRASDRRYLAEKLAAGRLRRHAVLLRGRASGRASSTSSPNSASTKPVLPGIMPVTTITASTRMDEMGADGAARPRRAARRRGRARWRAGGSRRGHSRGDRALSSSCSSRARPVCTSTRSTARRRRARSITRSSPSFRSLTRPLERAASRIAVGWPHG